MENRKRVGASLGLLVFLAGVALLGFTFKLAYDMFQVPPDRALGLTPNAPMNLNSVGSSVVGLLLRVLLLFAMAAVGSLIANRGVSLFAGAWADPNDKGKSAPDKTISEGKAADAG